MEMTDLEPRRVREISTLLAKELECQKEENSQKNKWNGPWTTCFDSRKKGGCNNHCWWLYLIVERWHLKMEKNNETVSGWGFQPFSKAVYYRAKIGGRKKWEEWRRVGFFLPIILRLLSKIADRTSDFGTRVFHFTNISKLANPCHLK